MSLLTPEAKKEILVSPATLDQLGLDMPRLLSNIASEVQSSLISDGYKVSRNDLSNGDIFLSITKRGFFRAISGFATAINLSLKDVGDNRFEAVSKFGFWDTQGIPTAITLLVFWPVAITQAMGYNLQKQLNDKIIRLVGDSYSKLADAAAEMSRNGEPIPVETDRSTDPDEDQGAFCPECGAKCGADAVFCSRCGKKIRGEA